MKKSITDIVAMLCLLTAIVTGFRLHKEVHHIFVYDDVLLWGIHETAGLLLGVCLALHCVQHKMWFNNYAKIPAKRKRVSTILLVIGILVLISGIVLMCGSQSQFASIFHYITAILFTLIALGHVAKRWKIFRSLF